jgi:DNA-binding LytR/AlgR family response regulator
MKYQVGICDDEAGWRRFLTDIVEQWAKERGDAAEIFQFENADQLLFAQAHKNCQILFLDIELGEKATNGMELARQIREENRQIQLIFVSGYMEYMQDGYDVDALHYLLKPVTKERVYGVLDKAAERIKTAGKVLLFESHGELLRIPLHEIRYIEVVKNYVTIHGEENYEIKRTLSEMEQELDERFFRMGRSFLVNLYFVKKITKAAVDLTDGTRLPLPRGMYDKINQAMIHYF